MKGLERGPDGGCLIKKHQKGKKIEIMKKMMILASAIMMAATANAKRVETASFDEVRVNVPARVRIIAGDTYSVNVAAQNEMVASTVRYEVKDGVLKINSRDIDELMQSEESLHITIVAPKELKLTIGRDMEAMNVRKSLDEKKDVAVK